MVVSNANAILTLSSWALVPGKPSLTKKTKGVDLSPLCWRPVEPDASRGACPVRGGLTKVTLAMWETNLRVRLHMFESGRPRKALGLVFGRPNSKPGPW